MIQNHIKFAYTGLRAFKGVYRPHLAKAMLLLNNALCMVISLTSKTLCFLGQPFNLLSKSSDCNCFSAITRPTHPFGQHSFEMSCYGNLIPTVRKSIFNLIFGRGSSQERFASSTGTRPVVSAHEDHEYLSMP